MSAAIAGGRTAPPRIAALIAGLERARMLQHGFVRVAAALPRLRVADCSFNVKRLAQLLVRAEHEAVHVLVFPELALTGYTCGDLFHQPALQKAALDALDRMLDESERRFSGVFIVGLPWLVNDQLYNVAAVCQKGQILGVVPKSYLPTYKEFYEARWFTPGTQTRAAHVEWQGNRQTPFGTDLLFADELFPQVVVGVEICEDLWTPVPPSCFQALAGAKVLVDLSASNEVIGKAGYRRQLVQGQSGRCIAGYVYTSNGVDESTTDVVFGGHAIIAENGSLLAESPRFQREDALVISDIDVERLQNDRQKTNSFHDSLPLLGERAFRRVAFMLPKSPVRLVRAVDAHT